MPNEHQVMISFPLLLKHMGVFILILIHSWSLMHKPLLHTITNLLQPLDVHFPLSTTCVHSPPTCTSHSDSSTGYYTWLGFFIFSTHHSRFLTNNYFLILGFFVIIDHHFVALGPICIGFSFSYVSLIVCFCFLFRLCLLMLSICLVLLVDGFSSLIFKYMVFPYEAL